MSGIIYRAINKITKKSYIGQTVQTLSNRIKGHYSFAKKASTKFSFALRKYDKKDWEWDILEDNVENKNLNRLEAEYIMLFDSLRSGYNSTPGGDSSPTRDPAIAKKAGINSGKSRVGKKRGPMPEEVKKKISKKLKGKCFNTFSDGHRKKLSETKIGNKNPMKNKDVAKKVSLANKGHENNSSVYKITRPDGTIEAIKNLNKYCREHSLSPGSMCLVSQGKRKHYKGYIVEKLY